GSSRGPDRPRGRAVHPSGPVGDDAAVCCTDAAGRGAEDPANRRSRPGWRPACAPGDEVAEARQARAPGPDAAGAQAGGGQPDACRGLARPGCEAGVERAAARATPPVARSRDLLGLGPRGPPEEGLTMALAPSPFDVLLAERAGTIPVGYLRALAFHES